MTNRRVFILQTVVGTSALASGVAMAAAPMPMVVETDAMAKSLGYAADATKVDAKVQKKFVAGSNCTNCALYQGKAGEAAGGCPLFAGKQVTAKGWCSAWAKKA